MITNHAARALTAGFTTLALAVGNAALANGEQLLSIPPGDMTQMIEAFYDQTGINVLYDYPVGRPWRLRSVVGTYAPLDALNILLRDTPLTYEVVNDRTVSLVPGSQYCQPWLGPDAPLPPCVQMPAALQGSRL